VIYKLQLQDEDRKAMKEKASVSHDEAMIRRLRRDPAFAAEYLKAAMEESDEPRVLLIALRHVARAHGIARIAKEAGVESEGLYRPLSAGGIRGCPRFMRLRRRSA
jgi:probable addiction module antidote protein